MKRSRDFGRFAAANAVENDALQQRPKIQLAAAAWKWIGLNNTSLVGQVLQPDSRLSLKSNRASESQQRGSRIKEAAHRGGGERANTLAYQMQRVVISRRKMKWCSGEITRIFQLRKITRGRLHRMRRRRIPARQCRRTQMRDAFESTCNTSGKHLAAPDISVITVTSPIETDPDHPLVPRAAFDNHGSDVSAMVLRRECLASGQFERVDRRNILRMRVVHHQQFIALDLVHGKQVFHRFLEGAKSGVVVQIADMLAHKSLAAHHQRDGVFEIRSHSKN